MSKNNLNFDPNELSQQGFSLLDQGNYHEAKKIFDKLLVHFPKNLDLLNINGYISLQINNYDESIEIYNKSIDINPDQEGVLFNRAIAYSKSGKIYEALDDYDALIRLNPDNLDAYINKSVIYEDLGLFEKALKEINSAFEYDSKNFMIISNRGKIYEQLMQFKKAEKDLDDAINLQPNNADAYINKGNFLTKILKKDEAKKYFHKALKLNPDSELANYNLALILLYEKNFHEGWRRYESRYFLTVKPNLTKFLPRLDNFNSEQKILIWADQGLGDQVFYSSIFNSVDSKFDITVLIDKRLLSIFKRSFPDKKFIESFDDSNQEKFEKQLSLISLGSFFRNDLNSFKSINKSFLKFDENKASEIKKKIKNNGKIICGLSWRSVNKKSGHKKSLELDMLLPILKMQNIYFVDLQYDDTKKETNKLYKQHGIKVHSIQDLDKFNDIEGVLALIACCNFIITVGNVTAHLSGAIAKKTYLLIPYGMETVWYWHNDKQSLWYPSISIYRQQEIKDWNEPVIEVQKAITKDFFKK